ncbi:MAG: hypothetical protein HYZ91_00210, partial [Candidatus Omnitrophica bacterium]|nr:hypothetical protein [Candidatus Omnitrophota bacterium]
ELQRRDDHVILFPQDNHDPRSWVPEDLQQAWDGATIPQLACLANAVKALVEPLLAMGGVTVLAGRFVAQRGLVRSIPEPSYWRVGFDILEQGIYWERPYHDSFLYDHDQLAPQRILHVVRGRLRDEHTRQYFTSHGIPFVESGGLPIPLAYFLRRILCDVWAGALRCLLSEPQQRDRGPFVWAALSVAQNLIRAELIEMHHQTEVFIGRDEYSVEHIIRTLLHDERGGRTIGFMHGDDTFPHLGNSYQTFHVFCVPGAFHHELLKWNTRYSQRTCLIGAGIYGLDRTYRLMQRGVIPEPYAELKKRSRLVGVFASSFEEDFFLTREMTLRFYRTALSVLARYPDVVVVVRPKGHEFADPAFRQCIDEAGSRAILEEHLPFYDLLPALDLVVCIATSTVGLEALMAGKPVLYFDESRFREHPYAPYGLVTRSPDELLTRIDALLAGTDTIDPERLAQIRSHHGLRFDGQVVGRLRAAISQLLRRDEAPQPSVVAQEGALA